MGVRSAARSHDEALHDVHTRLVNAAVNRVSVVAWEGIRQISDFLGQPNQLSHGRVEAFG